MKQNLNWIAVGCLAAAMMPWQAWAQEGPRNFHATNRLRFEYDDNVNETSQDEQDSFKLIESVDLVFSVTTEQSFLSLRYQPSFTYWENREDDSDLHHAFDGVAEYALTPRLSLSLRDTLRMNDKPEVVDRAVLTRQSNDFLYNSVRGGLNYLVREATKLEVAGRYITVDYDEDDVAAVRDYDLVVGGLTLRHAYRPTTSLLGEFRYENLAYADELRDSDTLYLGTGIDHTFNPSLISKLRLGYQGRDFDSTVKDSQDTPYVEAALTFLPTPGTRLTSGISFSQYEADVAPYAGQDRTRFFASLAHDFTAKISGYVTGAYSLSEYDGSNTPDGDRPDGEEDLIQFSARATYQLNRQNFLEAGYQYTDLSTDLREEFTRNRLNVGWVLRI